MAQQLRILQSLWAMERRRADEHEWPLQTQLAMIRDAGFDGAELSDRWQDALVLKDMVKALWKRILDEESRDTAQGSPQRRSAI